MADQVLRFGDLVKEDLVIDRLDVRDRTDALQKMSGLLVEKGYCRETFTAAILERERIHPSGLPMAGHKIAIPHADAEHVITSAILFVRLDIPVEWCAMGSTDDRISVQLVSMFALKEKRLIGDMLETLLTVYQHNEVLNALIEAKDSGSMFTILKQAVKDHEVRR
ncbi:MAG: PTS sugar transporter subunit IIA [Spirochaetaceae bacterium]